MTQRWTLDRNLSAGLIVAVLFQAGAFIWYGSKLNSRVATLESSRQADTILQVSRDAKQEDQNKAMTAKIDDVSNRLSRIEGLLMGKPVGSGAAR